MSIERDSRPEIEVIGVSKSYGKFKVLDNVSLAMDKGEALAVIGPSGSGKTTLLRCINFLEDYQEGLITVGGECIGYEGTKENLKSREKQSERQIAEMRTKVGMVFQSFNLFPHMTVLENIILAPMKISKIPKDTASEIAINLLDRVGLKEKSDVLPASLSGGQQQRVAIARALAMRPKAMLFDEVTSALDPELVGEVLEVVRELIADGMTMIIVTHEMSFARAFSSRVVFMANGKILEVGPPDEVFENPNNPRLINFLERFRKGYKI